MNKTLVFVPMIMLSLSTGAHAQSRAASQQLFDDASQLLKQGKVHEACLKFVESQNLEPQLGTLLNIATCHEKEGKVASAWDEYKELAALATKKGDAKRAAYAKGRVAELEVHLPHLQLEVPPGVDSVSLDGVALGQAAWATSLPMDPGDHEIHYGGAGKVSGVLRVLLNKDELKKAALPPLADQPVVALPTPQPLPADPTSLPTPTQSIPPPSSGGGGVRTGGFVVGALGIVGLGVGGAFGALALGSKGDVGNNCVGNQCTQTGLDAVDAARAQGTISTVALIAGGVFLVTGVTMILVGGKHSSQVGIAPMPGAPGLSAVGTF